MKSLCEKFECKVWNFNNASEKFCDENCTHFEVRDQFNNNNWRFAHCSVLFVKRSDLYRLKTKYSWKTKCLCCICSSFFFQIKNRLKTIPKKSINIKTLQIKLKKKKLQINCWVFLNEMSLTWNFFFNSMVRLLTAHYI